MGCRFSRSQSCEINARVFRVYNMDDQGTVLSPGRIEVGDTGLILYQKGKSPIKWPLRCLRNYGFNAELFSFESGRQCPTGPGIYMFKSRNAEALFNMVQECILHNGQDDNTRVCHNLINGTSRTNSRPHSITESSQEPYLTMVGNNLSSGSLGSSPPYVNGDICHRIGNNGVDQEPYIMMMGNNLSSGSLGNSPLYVNGDICHRNSHEYVNANTGIGNNGVDQRFALLDFLHNPNLKQPKEQQLDLPRSLSEDGRLVNEANSGRMIAGFDDITPISLKRYHNYINLSLIGEVVNNNNNDDNDDDVTVNYIQLDLDNQTSDNRRPCNSMSPTSPTSFNLLPDSPSKNTENYITIDFKRMAALSNAKKSAFLSDGPNVRKTRHNSTIGDIN